MEFNVELVAAALGLRGGWLSAVSGREAEREGWGGRGGVCGSTDASNRDERL